MSQRKTYFLGLDMLLPHLSDQSCTLTTTLKISGKVAGGTIFLRDGQMVSCSIQFEDGAQIIGLQAYKYLETCKQWQVELERAEEKKKTPPPSTQFSGQIQYLPPLRQKRPLNLSYLQTLSMKERLIIHSVFAIVNGKRTVEEIKTQLHFSANDVDDALARLRMLDFIE
ncbi:MAG TPA: hypothetical protein VFN35_00770 [Ktedonobacteraceae bacterium]|nr:hypothetical protein [Ktedonobacteraceae bacterium]